MPDRIRRRLVAFVGCSGSGKTTFMQMLVLRNPERFQIVRSLMTRIARDDWETTVFDFVTRAAADVLRDVLVHYEEIGDEIYGLMRTRAEEATENHIGLICLSAEGIRQLRHHGYEVYVVSLVNDSHLSPDDPRRKRDALLNSRLVGLEPNLELNNTWGRDGLEQAFGQLWDFLGHLHP